MGRDFASGVVQRDWVLEMEEAGKITSVEMQYFVNRMGAQTIFNAPELAAILGTGVNSVYALCEAGEIGYIDRGSRSKHYYVFPRVSILKFLQQRCNKV